ncbi:MAG: WD40/YVTN/BNR-like repeat-containing protein [Thermomicrobiales bacterium]
MFDTYLGTTGGVYHLHDTTLIPLGLADERVWAIHAWRDQDDVAILAGSYGNGLYRSADGGHTWARVEAGLTASAFRCLGPDPQQPGVLLAGTEPARLFRSADGGQTWQELAGITQIAGHEQWYLPYSPRAGAVRNVYAPPGGSGRLFASVEVGGLLRSGDSGETWACAPVLADDDIHYITGHPEAPDLLYAALGSASLTRSGRDAAIPRLGGIARSRDGGKIWAKLETDYTRAVLVPPSRPDLVLAGPAPNVGREGRIVVSMDGGDTWTPASDGLETPMPDMVELFVAAPDDSIWAICSGGRLLRAVPGEWRWEAVLPAGADLTVQSVAFVPRGA